jgi:flagellar hook-associated protein 1
MSDLLSIGASGLRAYSRALSTVSDNIANSQTEGYARRSIVLEEAPPGGDNALHRVGVRPGGVVVAGVARAVDSWLTEDARVSASDAGRSASRLSWTEAAERALDDGQGGIAARVTGVFNRADQLTADPGNTALRNQFLGSVDEAAQSFRQSAAALQSVANGIASEAQGVAVSMNNDLSALERVNDGLRRAREGSTNQATLLDERDRLIDNIASNAAVTATFDSRGAASLRMSGPSGEVILTADTSAQFLVTIAANGQIGFSLSANGSSPVTPISGRLAGLTEAANHVTAQRGKLDVIADQFASDLNAAHQSGFDTAGNAGAALLTANGGAAGIAAIALSARQVAASDGNSANGNMLALSGLRGPSGTEASLAALIASQSQTTAAARAQNAAAATRRDGAFDARDTVSAVDLDHEAAELLRFQQAYEGAARVIQVARETMQTILNVF